MTRFLDIHKFSKNQRQLTALHWIHKHGWTTSTILMTLFGVGHSVSSDLVSECLVEARPTPANKNSTVKGYPHRSLSLTAAGTELLVASGVPIDVKTVQPLVLTADHAIRHDAGVQFLTAKAVQLGLIDDFEVPSLEGKPSQAGEKQPDMTLITGESRHALELEASRKSNEAIADFINKCFRSLRRNGGPYSSVQIVTNSPYIHELYYLTLFNYANDLERANPVIRTSIEQIRGQLINFDRKDLLCFDLGLTPFY